MTPPEDHTAPPEATIVIPLLRQPDGWLEQCVRSALEQSVPVDVIVVPSDRTPKGNRDVLDRLGDESPQLRLEQRPGPSFAEGLNEGIKQTRTDRVGFLLADDWIHPTAVERCLAHDADIVSSQVANYSEDGSTPLDIERRITMDKFNQLESDQQRASYLSHFYLFKRAALLSVGGVDPTIGDTGADDYDMIWTLLEHGATVHIVEEILYFKRDHHGERLTLRDRDAQIADLEKILDKHRVFGHIREDLIARHASWYGRPIHEVVREKNQG